MKKINKDRIKHKKMNKNLNGLLTLTVIVIIWAVLAGTHVFSDYVFPGPGRVLKAFVSMAGSGELFVNTGISLLRVVVGFVISSVLAFFIGTLMVRFPAVDPYIEPLLEFIRHVPPISLIPLLILWFGIGEPSKLIVIILTAFFPVFMNTTAGLKGCDRKLIEVGEVLHMSKNDIFIKIRIPAAIPNILVGMKIGLGYSWRAIVAAEMIAASRGLGYLILDSQAMSRTDKVFVGIIVIGILGILMDRLFDRLIEGSHLNGR